MFTLTLGNDPLSRAYVFRWIWNYHRANLLLLWMHLLFRWKFCMSNQSRVLASDRKKDKTCESETTLKKEHEIKHLVEFFFIRKHMLCFNYASMYKVYMIYTYIYIVYIFMSLYMLHLFCWLRLQLHKCSPRKDNKNVFHFSGCCCADPWGGRRCGRSLDTTISADAQTTTSHLAGASVAALDLRIFGQFIGDSNAPLPRKIRPY